MKPSIKPQFRFRPIHYSWVAIHPHPVGVVNFIGGAFFGTFPTVFYRYLIRQLFDVGYTVLAMPFSFTFQHWSQSIQLFTEWKPTLQGIKEEAKRLGYDSEIYEEDPSSLVANYFWVGHSLGTKYIALLEYLSDFDLEDLEKMEKEFLGCNQNQPRRAKRQFAKLVRVLRNSHSSNPISLLNQPSLLLAPDISDTQSAIRIKCIADLIDKLGWGVEPTKKATFCLIQQSDLYQLMALIAFEKDKIARETVERLKRDKLKCDEPDKLRCTTFPCGQLPGGHLQPLGFRGGDRQLTTMVIDYLNRLANSETFLDEEKA